MRVEYRFASQGGDLPADSHTLDRPFLLSPGEAHPILTLRGYFDAIRTFVLQSIARIANGKKAAPDRLIIRSEKHGALYHVASVELFFKEESTKLALSTALSNRGKACLNQEEVLLRQLEGRCHDSYLPRVYLKGEVPAGEEVFLSVLMTDWFEDYHEWHLAADQSHNICIWDQKRGNRIASEKETSGIYRESSKILTLYYDMKTFRQIRPWHHAAGDFVLNSEDEQIRVRLTTVRGYEPLDFLTRAEPLDPIIGLVYFFLDLSTKMRLDRIDGTGAVIWADDFCLRPMVEGFLEAVRFMAGRGEYTQSDPEDFIRLLKSFSAEEVKTLFHPLLELYEREDDGGFSVIEANTGTHADSLWRLIEKFPE